MMCEFQFYYAHYKKKVERNYAAAKNFVTMPAQHQNKQPGIESLMNPLPQFEDPNYKGSEKLKGKNVLITGGDSGIGRAVSIAFAKEGANIAIAYLDEEGMQMRRNNMLRKKA